MTRALWPHRDEIARRLAAAPHWLVCFDFDGTLTPIVSHPDQAQLCDGTRDKLRTLAAHPGVDVAIVSGRALEDLSRRVAIPGLILAGNHGLEIVGRDIVFLEPTAIALRAELQALASLIERDLRAIPGAHLENKKLTLSVHFRQAAVEHHEEIRRIVQGHAALHDGRIVITPGSMVWEVRPRVDWHKGAAVNWIRRHVGGPSSVVLYVGDDRTDEDAFRALPREITVKVGTEPTAANYFLEKVDDASRVLDWLLKIDNQCPTKPAVSS